jgi:MoaA/NifB/PqqE/SkfB family radical SAM enzyme
MNKEKDLTGYYCSKPFDNIEVHLKGEVFFCCPSWLKTSIGDLETQQIKEVWNSPKAQMIRESILDGSYRHCDKTMCPYIQSSKLEVFEDLSFDLQKKISEKKLILEDLPEKVMLVYDLSCNLSCPSCRTQKIIAPPGSESFKKVEFLTDKINDEFIKTLGEGHLLLNITGSGDPFASGVFRKFLENLEGEKYPNLKIDLQTNGLLFNPKMWEKLSKIHKNINQICVSIDAVDEETYTVVRRDGSWPILVENMKFLAKLRKLKKFNLLQARFVVQKSNYKEMDKFAKYFLKLGCDVIEFSILSDWNTWKKDVFDEQCVWHENHREYLSFLMLLSNHIFGNQRVFLGNLTPYRNLAVDYKIRNTPFFKLVFYLFYSTTQRLVNILTRFKFAVSKHFFRP